MCTDCKSILSKNTEIKKSSPLREGVRLALQMGENEQSKQFKINRQCKRIGKSTAREEQNYYKTANEKENMFIDIHTHAFRKPPVGINPQKPNEHIATVEDLIEMFDTYEIEKGAVLPMVSSEVYLTQANEDILDMAEKYPDRIIPFCNIDPRYGSNSSETPLDMILQYYKNKGCKGIGEVMPLFRPKGAESVSLCGKSRSPCYV